MLRLTRASLLILFSITTAIASAQGELPVNMYTGTPIISVPLGGVSDHDLNQPIGLSYNAKGVRLDETTGDFGTGWNLEFGGSIRREVRGLPDDFTGSGSDLRRGWLYKNASNVAVNYDVSTLSNTSNLSASDCSDELNDFNKINGFGYNIDTEPDIFFYDVNGLSGSFVFDNSDPAVIRLMPYANITITPTFVSATNKTITSFKITDNGGNIYSFSTSSSETKLTRLATGISAAEFLKTDFQFYDSTRVNGSSGLSYRTDWVLTKIESHTGAYITYTYTTKSFTLRDTVRAIIRNYALSPEAYTTKNIYSIKRNGVRQRISSIQASSGPRADFIYSTDVFEVLTKVSLTDTRRPTGDQVVKDVILNYTSMYYYNYARKFLTSVYEVSGCDQLPAYKFAYAGNDNGPSTLPPPTSKSKDFWGYFNGKPNNSLAPKLYVYPALDISERYRIYPIANYAGYSYTIAGADRTADDNSIIIGTLNNIIYPSGGSTTIEYEPNMYYDAVAQQNFSGGGLRVKRVTYFDGVNAQANIVKTYDYTDPNNANRSSGRVLTKPSFAIPTFEYRDPSNNNIYSYTTVQELTHKWSLLTVRTEDDLTPSIFTQGSQVGYTSVKVSRPNAGYSMFSFLMPATFGDAPTGDWSASANKFARSSACPPMNIISSGGSWSFPYATDPNFDYERGLISSNKEFDQQNHLIRETQNTYQTIYKTGTTAQKTYGVKFEKYPYGANTFLFSKYYLLTDVIKVPASETVTTYDAAYDGVNNTSKMVEMVEYFYESNTHKLLSRIKKTNPDGKVFTQRFKYPLDYGSIPSSGTDKASEMLRRLQSDTYNTVTISRNGTPIEVLSTTGTGANEKVLSGSVVKYSDFDKAKPLLKEQLALSITTPINYGSFINSSFNNGGGTFATDANYEVVSTVLAYDNFNMPKSSVEQGKTVSSILWGYSTTLPVATVTNANAGEYAFSDFETNTGSEFTSLNGVTGTGRSGNFAGYPLSTWTKTVTKTGVKYILSLWFKRLSNLSQVYTVTLKNSTGTTVSGYPITWTVTATGSDFEYVEKVIDVSGVNTTTFSITIQGVDSEGVGLPVAGYYPALLPMMDDLAFYPADADLASTTYTIPFGANSATVKNKTGYTQYDKLGRVKYTYDQFKNITSKTTYAFPSDPTRTFTSSITAPAAYTIYDDLLVFSATDNCIDGTTYEWNFGDGWVTGTKDYSYRFTTPGLKTVSLKIIHPLYGSVTLPSRQYSVLLRDCNVTTCAKGVQQYDICTGSTVSTYSCTSITSTPPLLGTTFKVLGIDVNETIQTYQWKIRNSGTTTWQNAVTTAEYWGSKIIPGTTTSYEVMCEITTNTTRKGYSPITFVTVSNSSPCN